MANVWLYQRKKKKTCAKKVMICQKNKKYKYYSRHWNADMTSDYDYDVVQAIKLKHLIHHQSSFVVHTKLDGEKKYLQSHDECLGI